MADLISLQTNPQAPVPEGAVNVTNPIAPPTPIRDRLRHMPEEVYDLSAESHLMRFAKVLLGDTGAGMVRKRMMFSRLRSTLQGSRFYDLDRFYGPLFLVKRKAGEQLTFDPQTGLGTTRDWDDARSSDASFRSRIEQLAKALSYGGTPAGIELAAEALLSVDCDVYESYVRSDSGGRTVADLETTYPVVSDLEGVSIATLESYQYSSLSGNERRIFIIRPKRPIDAVEAYDLRRVLNRIKPADTRLVIESIDRTSFDQVSIASATADSEHWEIIREIGPLVAGGQQSADPVERPRPAFSAYQGEAWSYHGDIQSVTASYSDFSIETGEIQAHEMPVQRVTYADHSTMDFNPNLSILPGDRVQAGRAVSDGILVTSPYPGAAIDSSVFSTPYALPSDPGIDIYSDGVPIDALISYLDSVSYGSTQDQYRYWVTQDLYAMDSTQEVLEVQLSGDRPVNYLTFEVARFPHRLTVEVMDQGGQWWDVYSHERGESFPSTIDVGIRPTQRGGHPHHEAPAHWFRVSTRIDRQVTSRVRITLDRGMTGEYAPPVTRARDERGSIINIEAPYTLAVRNFDLGFRVTSRDDYPEGDNSIITSTKSPTGEMVRYRAHELVAENLIEDDGYWRCEPQPVNYSVVSLHLDTRDGTGAPQVIDSFYLDPTHVGAHLTLYWSNDSADAPADPEAREDFFAARTWTPISRDYLVHQGYIHLPPTSARYWKFEFTNLSAEPYESFLDITRRVRLFPTAEVDQMVATTMNADDLGVVIEGRYRDALSVLSGQSPSRTSTYLPTEALYFPDLQADTGNSWVFSFTPWQQGSTAPRFSRTCVHRYSEVEVSRGSKISFFVGLKSISALRTNWQALDDPTVYYDTLDDPRNLEAGFTWDFNPGVLRTDTVSSECVATSKTILSNSRVTALQFASVQSEPAQMLADPDFRDPALVDIDWRSPDGPMAVGDSETLYSPSEAQVVVIRRVDPLTYPGHDENLSQQITSPVFSSRNGTLVNQADTEAQYGGLASAAAPLDAEGWAYAATRVTALTDLTSPLVLQLWDDSNDVMLAEQEIVLAQAGAKTETFIGWRITGPNVVVRARVIQHGKSDDAWKVDSLAVFEDPIVWEWSNNGGSTWLEIAPGVKSNDRGLVTFPLPGNQLRYRVRCHRKNSWVGAVKIRPWYEGRVNARADVNHRGPNVSVYDQDIPVVEDPMFTSWKRPIPRSWFEAERGFQSLPIEGAPAVTEFARFYARTGDETIPEPVESVTTYIVFGRTVEERVGYFFPISETTTRILYAFRQGADTAAATEVANRKVTAFRSDANSAPASDGVIHQVIQNRSVSESVPAATDTQSRQFLGGRSVPESAPASDSLSTVRRRVISSEEALSVSDDASAKVLGGRLVTETVGGTDAPTKVAISKRTVNESIAAATDSVSFTIIPERYLVGPIVAPVMSEQQT